MKKGSNFQLEIMKSLQNFGGFWYKIPDLFIAPEKSIKRPFDIAGCYKGHFYAIELKQQQNYNRIYKKCLPDHQFDSLLKVHNEGGTAYIIVNIRCEGLNYCEVFLIEEWEAKGNYNPFIDLNSSIFHWHFIKKEKLWDISSLFPVQSI